MTRADALRPHLKFRRWRGRFGVMTENQNHIKATACRIWKFAEKIACRFSNRIAIVWTVSVLVWLAAIAASFIFDKWWTVRNFVLFSTPLLGFPLLFQRTMAQDKQADAAIKRAESALMQAKTDSDRRLAEAYAQAANLFASVELSLRLAGLYALWSLAQEDIKNHHVQVMQILCAFVRRPLILNGWESEKIPAHRPDMEAVLKLIRERKKEQWEQEEAAEYHLDFRGAILYGGPGKVAGIKLFGAYLRRADFTGADLRCAVFDKADLQSADFGDADLRDAHFYYADIRNAYFQRTNMANANLRKAAMNDAKLWESINLSPCSIKKVVVLTNDEGGKLPSYPYPPSLSSEFEVDEDSLNKVSEREWQEKREKIKG